MLTARKTAEARKEAGRGAALATKSAEGNGTVRTTEPRTTPALHELLLRIEGEYREMPGLSLTLSQAQRLWGLDRSTCEFVLAKLIERRVLRRAMDGAYVLRAV